MKIRQEEVNSIIPYILNSYDEKDIHPRSYNVTVNKYCVKKAKEEDFQHDVLLHGDIDFLFPVHERMYAAGRSVIMELCKRNLSMTLVSASDFLATLPMLPEIHDKKHLVKIIVPFYFYFEEDIKERDAVMPDLETRMQMFKYLQEEGYNVKPFFNTLPEYNNQRELLIQLFRTEFPDHPYDERENSSMSSYIITENMKDRWRHGKPKKKKTLMRSSW